MTKARFNTHGISSDDGWIPYFTSTILKPIALGIICILIATPATHAAAQLSIDTVYPSLGKLGEDLSVEIRGTGFDADTRVSMDFDAGNSRLIKDRYATGGRAWDAVIDGDLAYVGFSGAGFPAELHIVNISRPSNPVLIGKVGNVGAPIGLTQKDDLIYVASADQGLYIVDVSNPSNPIVLGSVDTPGFAWQVTVVGTRAYIADAESGLQIIDVSNPSSPFFLGSLDVKGNIYDVKVKGQYAYLASRVLDLRQLDLGLEPSEVGLKVVDISDPKSPKEVKWLPNLGSSKGITIVDKTAYIGLEAGFAIVDVADPLNPELLNTVDTIKSNATITSIDIVGNKAYAAGGFGGLLIFDIENSANVTHIGTIVTSDQAYAVTVIGNTAYVAAFSAGLEIIDVTTPDLPTPRQLLESSVTRGIFVEGNTAYLATGSLQIKDISTPGSPRQIATINTEGDTRGVVVRNGIAYLAKRPNALQIVDIRSPSNPIILGEIVTPGNSTDGNGPGIDVEGNRAYITDGDLQIIDISDPANPKFIATVKTPDTAEDVDIVGNIAYVADRYGGLQIMDISNINQPRIIGNLESGGTGFEGVAVQGNRAYLAGSGYGLFSVDISNPALPVILDYLDRSTSYNDVAIAGNTLYGAGYGGTLVVPLPPVFDAINVISPTRISLTLPSPAVAGDYTLRVSNNNTLVDLNGRSYKEFSELYGAVTFAGKTPVFSEPVTKASPVVVSPNAVSKAIIIAGGGPYPGNALWPATLRSANYAYRALLFQGYRRENIQYLNPDLNIDVDGDGAFNDIDGTASAENLEDAILRWTNDAAAPAHELLLYIVDHGGDAQFRLNETTLLSAQQLDAWLDELQQNLPGKVLVVYDACQSGTFIPKMTPPAGKSRIVITSAADESAYFINQGGLSFSYQFWSSVFSGASLYDSFVFGKRMMLELQTAQVDSNGNGIPNEKADKELAHNLVIGRGFIPASDKPFISAVSGPKTIQGTTKATISASGIIDATGISRVWGVISHPALISGSKDIPVLEAPEIELTDPDGDNTWVGSYDGFTLNGVYTISVYAQNKNGFYSIIDETNPSVTTVQQLTSSIDNDRDNDGVDDLLDAFPDNANESADTDRDGIGNNADGDDDNDSVPDVYDAYPLDSSKSSALSAGRIIQEATLTMADGILVLPLLDVIRPGKSPLRIKNVSFAPASDCSELHFRLKSWEPADGTASASSSDALSVFSPASRLLTSPVLEVLSTGRFGGLIVTRYEDAAMSLDPSCKGVSLVALGATLVQ